MQENVLFFLKHKNNVKYFTDSISIRDGLHFLQSHTYSAMPVIDNQGRYLGSISEGDFLRYIIEGYKNGGPDLTSQHTVRQLIRPDFMPAKQVDVSIQELFDASLMQNYVPVIDDRGIFIGIVTRQEIIRYLLNSKLDPQYLNNAISDEHVHNRIDKMISR